MAEEQAISSELPRDEELKQIAFWIERVVAFLLVLCLFPITYHFLLPAMSVCLLLLSNYFYITTYISPLPQVIRAEPPPTSVPSTDDKSEGGGKLIKDEDIAFWIERAASCFLVLFWCLPRDKCWHILHLSAWLFCGCSIFYLYLHEKESGKDESGMDEQKTEQEEVKLDFNLKEAKEEVKAKDEMNNIIDEENTGQQKAKLDDSPKESKEEGKAKDERINKIHEENARQQTAKVDIRVTESKEEGKAKDERINKIDKENTEQERAKLKVKLKELEVSLKELKEEVGSSSSVGEGFQSLEAKYLAKYENLLQKYLDKCHGNWEEERSQLMYELGAARASLEIYRALLHDLHYHQP